jgi:type VI protein secretion system component VasK
VQQQATHPSQVYSARGKAVARGSRKFGEAMWRPFAHASGVLWLEVTGLFFAIFTLYFAVNTYKLRHEWAIGPDHQRFLVYSVVTLAFAYFTFSSFYRARQKEKLKRQTKP